MGPSRPQVGPGEPFEGAVVPRPQGRRDRPAGGPRVRVHGAPEPHRHRAQQLAGRRGREHGPFQLHIAQTPRGLLRPSLFLSHVQWEERRVCGRSFPEEGRAFHSTPQDVSSPTMLCKHAVLLFIQA